MRDGCRHTQLTGECKGKREASKGGTAGNSGPDWVGEQRQEVEMIKA